MKQKVPANIFGPQIYCPWCVSLSLRKSLEKIKFKLNLNKFENLNFLKFGYNLNFYALYCCEHRQIFSLKHLIYSAKYEIHKK